jgi:hypothetical protein
MVAHPGENPLRTLFAVAERFTPYVFAGFWLFLYFVLLMLNQRGLAVAAIAGSEFALNSGIVIVLIYHLLVSL